MFGGASSFTVLSTVNERVGERSLLQWRFRSCRDGRSTEIIEQVAFADVGPAGIYRLHLLCSGFLPDAGPKADAALRCTVEAHR
jgi:hypothetical protein